MLYSRIAPVVLWIVIIVTIVVMFVFYAGSSFVNKATYQAKVNKIENPEGTSPGSGLARDLQSADSLAVGAREAVTPVTAQAEPVELSLMEKLVYFKTDIPIYWGYALLILTIIIALAFPAAYVILHPKNLIKTLLVLVGVAVIIGLAYMVSSGAPMEITGYTGTANSNPVTLKVIDSGLITTYFVFGLALISIIVSEIVLYFR